MAALEIQTDTLENGLVLVSPRGRLDVFSFFKLREYFDGRKPAAGQRMVVDLEAVDFLASSGWSVLLSRRKAMKKAGGEMMICGLNAQIQRVYDDMSIGDALPSAPDRDQAVRRLSAASLA